MKASVLASITVASLQAAGGAAVAAPVPVEQTVDVDVAPLVLPGMLTTADFAGFGFDQNEVVEPGDSLWTLAERHYGFCDQQVIERHESWTNSLG